jgi:hypothetical protein
MASWEEAEAAWWTMLLVVDWVTGKVDGDVVGTVSPSTQRGTVYEGCDVIAETMRLVGGC